jgi:AcrR family transcriptional regulator
MTASASSTRSMLIREKLMRTAERLYAEHGLASVSVRKIGVAAGQRNKSVVQYHFTNRDELIKAILARHTAAIETHRFPMVAALGASGEISSAQRMACLIMPTVEHHIELGTPSWYGRFLAQVLVEPAIRDHTMRMHLNTPSLRRLNALGHLGWPVNDPELFVQQGAMIRQFTVHMCAELEYDLAHGRIDAANAEASWRRLGADVIKVLSGLRDSRDIGHPADLLQRTTLAGRNADASRMDAAAGHAHIN